MLFRILKGTVLAVTAVVAIPYTVAIACNFLYGWPQGKHKLKRALSPRKVCSFNYALYLMLRDKPRFLFLLYKWKRFYRNADPRKVLKNLAFGRNDNTLDVYIPSPEVDTSRQLPVVIFIYGGSYNSGNKNMYGLLCSQVVDNTNSVVVCPNYSLWPKGYVDDMIQDVVDCICWVMNNIHEYGGDRSKIVLMGHSAGAHLGMMAVLELLHDERTSVNPSFRFQPAGQEFDELGFAESHYGRLTALERAKEGLGDSSGSSESFAVVSENGEQSNGNGLESSSGAVSLLGSSSNSDVLAGSKNSGSGLMTTSTASTVTVETDTETQGKEHGGSVSESIERGAGDGDPIFLEKKDGDEEEGDIQALSNERISARPDSEEERAEDDSDDNDSVVTVRPKDIEKQTSLVDMCRSIKAFIGIAGMYSISDHYEFEYGRGIEDVSCMCRAHYGEDHFQRFSPTQIIQRLGRCLSLPPVVLIHGTKDYVVPPSSSVKFSEALSEIYANVKVKIIPDCDHYEACLDLMEADRKFYAAVMSVVMETVSSIS